MSAYGTGMPYKGLPECKNSRIRTRFGLVSNLHLHFRSLARINASVLISHTKRNNDLTRVVPRGQQGWSYTGHGGSTSYWESDQARYDLALGGRPYLHVVKTGVETLASSSTVDWDEEYESPSQTQ